MEKHQIYAILISIAVTLLLIHNNGFDNSIEKIYLVGISLCLILFYRIIAWLSAFIPIAGLAKDRGSPNHLGPYAFFFWCLFIAACFFVVLN